MRIAALLLLLPAVFLACGPAGEAEGDAAGECSDDADEDQDGLFDCDDPDCAGASVCSGDTAADTDTDADTDADTDTDTDTDTDSGGDTGWDSGVDTGACDVAIQSTTPADGATNAYFRADIEFQLTDADATARVRAPFAGVQSMSEDGQTIYFTPTAPLTPGTSYSVSLDGCFGSVEVRFRTSAYGLPLEDAAGLLGRVWTAELAEGRIVEPPGIGSVLSSYLTQVPLGGVTALQGDTFTALLATATKGRTPTQDLNFNTHEVTGVDFRSSPFFHLDAGEVSMSVAGYVIPVDNVELEGTFAADGSSIGGMWLTGRIDTRPLSGLVDDSGNEAAICELAVNFGAECTSCADGEPYCLTYVEDQLEATEVPSTSLVEVTGQTDGCSTVPAAPTWVGVLLAAWAGRRRGGVRGRQ